MFLKLADRAQGKLKSISNKTYETTRKRFHAFRVIAAEAEYAKEDNYQLPTVLDFTPSLNTVLNLQDRYKTAIKKLDRYVDDHFGLNPDDMSRDDMEALGEFLERLEAKVRNVPEE